MTLVRVDTLSFTFDDSWQVGKYDEWGFYKNRFQKIVPGVKAVDLVAISPDATLYLLEAKDFRLHPIAKPSELHTIIARKVLDTLAAMLPLSLAQGYDDERAFAVQALACRRIRVVFHLEQGHPRSRVAPGKYPLENIRLKIRQALKSIDAHATVADMEHMSSVSWTCR